MNSPAEQIAAALDEAMRDYYGPGKRLSGAELARLSGVPQPTISRTLKGKSIPETETLSKLITALGADRVKLPEGVKAMIGGPAQFPGVPMNALTTKIFPLICPQCHKVSHKSFIELEANDTLPCDCCGVVFNINDQYGHGELKMFLESLGGSGISLRQNRKF